MNKYLLVDGNNIASRAAHASWSANPLSTVDGVPTAALMIFAKSIIKMIIEEKPTHIAVAWDGKSRFRLNLLPTYKANRKPAPNEDQKVTAFTMMKAFLQSCGIQNFVHKDFEADDFLAAWWRDIRDADEIVIVTGDKDLLQLLGRSPRGYLTTVRRPVGAGVTERWTAERFEEEFSFPPAHWSMVTSLTGDTSDNVDGIRGIGPKKAVKLLERHGWDLQRAILEEHPEHKELIERNMKLVDLVTVSCGLVGQLDMAIQPFTAPKPDSPEGEVLDYFLTAFELAEIQAKFHRGALWTGPLIAGRPLRRPPVMKGGLS